MPHREIRRVLGTQLRKGSPSERVEKILALLIESGFVYCLLWSLYLLSAYGVLPGAGSYIVNIGMLYSRVCIQRSSLLSSACRSVKMRTPLGQNSQLGTGWISRKLNFQLVQPRLRAVNLRPRIVEGRYLRCLSLLHADGLP